MRRALSLAAFRRLALAYTLNEVGDWFATIALTVLVFDRTGEALATAALFLSTRFLPSLAVPFLASYAERGSVRVVLSIGYVAEALVFVLLAAAGADMALGVLCLVAMLDGTLAATARAVTRGATVAILEPAGQLREGNSLLNIGFSVVNVAAPATAGLAVAQLGAPGVLWIVAGIFLGLAVLMGTARGTPRGIRSTTRWTTRLREGFAYVRGHRIARGLLALQAVLLVLFNIAVPIEVIYAKEVLDAGDIGFGALLAAWGGGMVAGSLLFARLSQRSLAGLVIVSTVAVCAGYLGMAAAPNLLLACLAASVGGLGNGVQWVAVITAIQEAIDDDMQARAAGMLEAVITAAPGLGFVVGGVLATVWDARTAFAVAGFGGLLVIAAAWLVWRRSDDAPPPQPAT
ncbi:MAG: MFS transporter [Solirubrobacteraceae bacterium]|nr:MFS transporter [Solirubrobacteraceae bacterium]